MTKSPQVTVFMPTKNRASSLSRAVASVLNQSFKDLELIVVDDGSTDDTPNVLAELAKQDSRMIVLRNDSSLGAPFSRNRAIACAKGHWITGLDDDDYFHHSRLEVFVCFWNLYSEKDLEPFSSLFSQDDNDNGLIVSRSVKRGSVNWCDLFQDNLIGNQFFTLTDRLRSVGGFDAEMPVWQDLELLIRILKLHGPAKLIDLSLQTVMSDERMDRISRLNRDRFVRAWMLIIKKHPEACGLEKQSLYLQMFGSYYNFMPTFKDFYNIISFGWHNRNMLKLAKSIKQVFSRRIRMIIK